MADPISIIGAAIGAFQFFKDLKDLGDKYVGAPAAVKDFQDECQITLDSLKIIEQVLKDSPDIVSKSATGQSVWTKCAEAAERVKKLVRSFAAELPKVKSKKKNKLGRWDKLTFIWDGDYFNEKMTAIRVQRGILEDVKSNVPVHQLNVILNNLNGLLGVNWLAPPGDKGPRTAKSDSNLQEALVKQLLEAVLADKVAEVKDILSNGLSPNIVLNENQDTALHVAAAEGRLKTVNLLLGTEIPVRAEINALNKTSETPLYRALNFNHANTSEQIIRHEPNIQLADSNLVTPLHVAAQRCLRSEVQRLISHGAHVNARDKNGLTPLFYATIPRDAKGKRREPDPDIINILLDADKPASLEPASFRTGTTVIHRAAEDGNYKVLELLLPKASKRTLNALTNDNHKSKRSTPLYLAVKNGNKASADALLTSGADPNIACTPGGRAPTALWAALRTDRLDIAEALLAAGADANATGADDERPIHYIVSSHSSKTTKQAIALLASHGADLNARAPKTSESPLDTAARTGRLDLVKSLLQHKEVDINGGAGAAATATTHRTPVMHAAYAGRLSVLHHLCAVSKADWKRATGDGAGETAFILAAGAGRLCCASYLLGRGAKLDEAAAGGYRALHYAARAGKLDAVKWLVVTGADWKKKAAGEREGFKCAGTALEVARAHGRGKVVEYLEGVED